MEFKKDPDFVKKRIAAMKEKKEDPNAGGRDYLFKKKYQLYTPRDGENIVRLLPGTWKDAYFPWVEAWIHYGVGVDNSQYFCLTKMKKKPCPPDEAAKNVDSKEAGQFNANHRAIAWVIDRLDEAKGPQLWPMPYKKVAHEILAISFSRKTGEPVFVDDPQDGRDIIFTKTGKGLKTQYSAIQKDDEPSPLHADEDIAAKWLEYVKEESIPDIMIFHTYEHIKAVLTGESGEGEVSETAPITSEEAQNEEVSGSVSEPEPEKPATRIPTGKGLSLTKLKAMNREQLEAVVEDRKLDLDPNEWQNNEEFVEAIGLELGLTSN